MFTLPTVASFCQREHAYIGTCHVVGAKGWCQSAARGYAKGLHESTAYGLQPNKRKHTENKKKITYYCMNIQ